MSTNFSVAAVIPAAGKGRRLGARVPKAFLNILGKPLFVHTLLALQKAYPFGETVLVVDGSRLAQARRQLNRHKLSGVRLTAGGSTRAESVRNGLLALPLGPALVAVHDAARPLVSGDVVRRTVEAALSGGGAICALPVSSTVKRLDAKSGYVRSTEDRSRLALAQTPQVFSRTLLLSRYRALGRKAFQATDEAALFDGTRVKVRVVQGDEKNLKVTTKRDLEYLRQRLKSGG